ncbi:septation protein A [Candidatus Pseudothioglobus singularis]|jgi:intracellular septation protein|uniref:inner membrane-spanning protein YciB n=1 Tax=Candidatus Pseudothioglobus singularis TaxID=1427364 RepID=UPI00036D7779|nr:inner membrane-spanning protein YciB [Candidatus Pseudothioglobus singularis]ANQ66986.1 septation protein A [Candidatus Pseudothioglobus singularis]MDG1344788.1 septation protein IspZ [Candidatus Thioglobus sp.]MDG1956667.1 septation protein IspZ [Candidatus Thioglobus sp.]
MKFLLDFGPIVLFFIVYKYYGLYAAIYAMIASTFVQIMYSRVTTGKFVTSQVLTFALLVVFGGISIVLRDPAFVMWKVSVLYVIFAAVLIGSNYIGSKTLLERMMGKELQLPRNTWVNLTWFWSLGFIIIAIINAFFVNTALSARNLFLNSGSIVDPKIDLKNFDCSQSPLESLCLIAQSSEESWVNFKLFGTLGLTLVLIIITVLMLSKHIKEKQTDS